MTDYQLPENGGHFEGDAAAAAAGSLVPQSFDGLADHLVRDRRVIDRIGVPEKIRRKN